jgi:hypothetical protein
LHDVAAGKSVDECVVGAADRHILELLPDGGIVEARCVRHYLADLTSCGIVVGPEIWQVAGRYAWLSDSAAIISIDISARCQPAYIYEECRADRYILEHLGSLDIREASRVRDYL